MIRYLPGRDDAEHVAVKMNHTALPMRIRQVLGYSFHEAAAGIVADQLDAVQTAINKMA